MTMRRLNRYKVIQIRRLSGIENFVSERDDFILNSFRNFKPVKRCIFISPKAVISDTMGMCAISVNKLPVRNRIFQ